MELTQLPQHEEIKQHQIYVRSQGEVEAKYHTVLVAQVDGVVTKLADAFVKGGFVSQGQLLAQIDPSDYQAALTEAEANLASAEAQLEQEKWYQQLAGQSIRYFMSSHHMRIGEKILFVNLTHLAKKQLVKQFTHQVHRVSATGYGLKLRCKNDHNFGA